ncbi:hypothetical protein SLS56_003608 [Neofusicoccum ribis]|uniref:Uncharacterized protein n=1 Tax=Neofusicoccum ribis TaxID=45134 RepID=A0ABR3SYV8_9PEZI
MPALWLSRLLAASPAPVSSVDMTIPTIEIGKHRESRTESTVLRSLSLNGFKVLPSDYTFSSGTSGKLVDRVKSASKAARHSRTSSSTSFDSIASTLVDTTPSFPDWLAAIEFDNDTISAPKGLWREVDGIIYRNGHKHGVSNSTHQEKISALEKDHNRFVNEISGVIEGVEEEAKATIASLNEEKEHSIAFLKEKHNSVVSSLRLKQNTAREQHKSSLASIRQDYKSTVSTVIKQHQSAIATLEQDHTAALSSLEAEHVSALSSVEDNHTSTVLSLLDSIEHLEAERISASVTHEQEIQTLRETYSGQLSKLSAKHTSAPEEKNAAIAFCQKEVQSLREAHNSTSKELSDANSKNSALKEDLKALRKSKDAAYDSLSASSQRLKEQDKVIASSLRKEIEALRVANTANVQHITDASSRILAEKEVIIQDLKSQLEQASAEHDKKHESMLTELISVNEKAEHNEKALQEVQDLLTETEEYKYILEEELEVANKERDEAQSKLRDMALDSMYIKNVEANNNKQAAHVRRLLDEKTPIENDRIRTHNENLRLKAEIQDLKTSNDEIESFANDVFDQTLPLLEDLQATGITNVATLAEMTNDEVITQLADWMANFMNACNHNIVAGRTLVAENRRLIAAATSDRDTINTLREKVVTQTDQLHDLDAELQDAQITSGAATANLAAANNELSTLKPQAALAHALQTQLLELEDALTAALTTSAPTAWTTVYDDMKTQLTNRTATIAALTTRLDRARATEHAHAACAAALARHARQADLNHQVTAALHTANHRLAREVGRLRERAGLAARAYEGDGGKGVAPACMRAMFEKMAECHGYELCEEDYVEADLMDGAAEEMAVKEVAPLEEEPRALERVAEGILDRVLTVGRDVLDDGKGLFAIKQRWVEPVAYAGDDEELEMSTSPEAEEEGERTLQAGQKCFRDAVEAVRETERRKEKEMAILEEEAF